MNSTTIIERAVLEDLSAILELQKVAFLSEAMLVNDLNVPPMTQTLESLREEFDKGIVLKCVDLSSQRIAGSIRGREEGDTALVGRLIVHPDFQGLGIGKRLLYAIEECFPGMRLELFTSVLSEKNQAIYQKIGYRPFKKQRISDTLEFVYMEKTGRPSEVIDSPPSGWSDKITDRTGETPWQ